MITSKRNSVSATMSEQEKRVEAETRQLLVDIQRIKPEGESYCLFGDLFVDPAVEQYYEALVGTLKAAKKKGLIQFDGQILFKGMHDHVQVSIIKNGNKPPNSTSTPTRRNSHVTPTMTTSSSQQQTFVISPTTKSSCMESSSSKNNSTLLLTPVKKDCFTQTSTSSTKKTILTPSHLRNQMMKKNIHIVRDGKPFLVKPNGEYKKKGFQICKEEKVNDDLSCCNTVDSGNMPRTIPVNRSVSIALNERLDSVAEGDLKNKIAETHKERVDREIRQLLLDIKRIEPKEEQFCSFGDLFVDEHVEQYYEALVGTLKAAKRKGLIHFQGQMLFKGLHDHVQIKIVE